MSIELFQARLAGGNAWRSVSEQILEEMPDLEADDIRACIADASRLASHPVLG